MIKKMKPIFIYFRSYIKYFVGLFFILLFTTGCSMITPLLTREIMDVGLIKADIMVTVYCSIGILLISVFSTAILFLENRISLSLNFKVATDIYNSIFEKLSKVRIKFFKDRNFSEIVNQIQVDVDTITSGLEMTLVSTSAEMFRLIGGAVGLFIICPKLTIIVVIYIPIKYAMNAVITKKTHKYSEETINAQMKSSFNQEEIYRNMEDIRIYDLIKIKKKEFKQYIANMLVADRSNVTVQTAHALLNELLSDLFTCSIYIMGVILIASNELTVGGVFAFITYSGYVIVPIGSILDIRVLFASIVPSVDRFTSLMSEQEESSSGEERPGHVNCIRFDKVSFAYDKECILDNISFEIKSKEKIAILGKNGAGKTTLINLLLRFHEPCNGTISLNSSKVDEYDLSEYRSLFSYVSQNITLFNKSLKENLNQCGERLEDISVLLKELNLYNMQDKVIGNNGSKLSGGQKQKLALCRALLTNREIIILDEPSSSTDEQTSNIINKMINTDFKDKIVIIITHDKNILSYVDRVICLDEEKIVYDCPPQQYIAGAKNS